MKNNWKETTLREIGKVVTGKTPPTSNIDFYGDAYPFITPTDIKDGLNYCTTDRYLSEKGKNSQKSILLPKNAVCYTCIASIGKVCMTQQESFTNQQINSVLVDEKNADYKFVFYLLKNLTPQIKKMAGGTITGIVNKSHFESFPFLIPKNKEEQKQIADILSSLDDKIELLRAENETLEKIAQTIFKEWFVKFNLPTEVLTKEGVNGKKLKLENGIPEGWRVGKLGNILSLEYGKALKEEDRSGKGFPVFGSNGVVGYHKEFLVKGDGIVVGRKGSMGKVLWVENNFYPIDTAFFVKDKLGVDKLFFHYFLLLKQDFEKVGSDSAVPGLNRNAACSITTMVPNIKAVNNFHDIIEPIFSKVKVNNSQIQALVCFRDTLLPKLMSGSLNLDL